MLKVWLPLNGDLHNQGLSDVIVTNNGATVNNAGKIGKCYEFDGNAHWLQFDQPLGDLYNNDYTIAVWLKPMDSTRSIIFSEYAASGASGVALELRASRGIRVYWNGSPDIYVPGSLPLDTWSHIAVVKTDGKIDFYVNGSLTYTYTGTLSNRVSNAAPRLGDDYRGGTSVSYKGCMNDFRLYSHALSPKEVKEISKGLVLHYPLNRGGFGQDNLLKGSKNFSGTWVNGGSWTTSDEEYKGFTVKEKSSIWGGITQNIPCSNGDIFTISFYAKVESGGTIRSVHRSSLGNVTTGLTILDGNFSSGTDWVNATDDATQWKKYWATVRIDSSDITYLQWRIENSISGKKLSICGMKIEEGSIATPWVPNSADALYSAMGLDDNIEYDVSGYGNNGVQNNTPTFSSDAPRYKTSIHFDGTNQTVKLPNLSTLLPDSIFTFNVWFKRLEAEPSSKNWETILGGPSGFELESCSTNSVHDSKIKAYSWGGGTFAFEFDKWNMLTMVQNGTNALFYLNGELKLTGTFKALVSGNYFLGSWKNTTSQNYRGYMSDARIYSTALSADDILALYNTPASIASNGTLLTQGEIAEV